MQRMRDKVPSRVLNALGAFVLVLFLSGVVQAGSAYWVQIVSNDNMTAGGRWAYAHELYPRNHYGFNGNVDTHNASTVAWDSTTGRVHSCSPYAYNPQTCNEYTIPYAYNPADMPRLRIGACLSWDGNVPGWWVGNDGPRPNLVLSGGLINGFPVDDVNIGEATVSDSTGHVVSVVWIKTLHLEHAVAFAACGRLTVRGLGGPDDDHIGVIVFNGYEGSLLSPQPTGWVQGVFDNVNEDIALRYAVESWWVGCGVRYGAVAIPKHMFAYKRENQDWYIWGGQGMAGDTQFTPAAHFWWDNVFSSVGCEPYAQTGTVPPTFLYAATTWFQDVSYANHPWLTGLPIMVIYGGWRNVHNDKLYAAKIFDDTNTFSWNDWTNVAPVPAARSSAILACNRLHWVECNNSGPTYYNIVQIAGGFAAAVDYDDDWTASLT